jgi:hypothetical protein
MAKAKVTFKTVRNSEEDWTIVAEYPGVAPREITGLLTPQAASRCGAKQRLRL